MSFAELRLMMPLVCLSAASVLLMLTIGVRRHHETAVLLTLAGLTAAIAFLPCISAGQAIRVTPLLLFDRNAVFFVALICGAGLATVFLAYGYLRHFSGNREEFYLLLLLAVLGATLLAVSNHFASLFLGLEILSVSLYTLIAYPHRLDAHVEAGLKYLILAAVSSAFLLFGMALFYAASGSMAIERVAGLLQRASANPADMWLVAGAALFVVAIGFKLAVVPFHMWTPDVYQGAPAPVTAFVATVSKGAVVALLIHLFPPDGLTAVFYTVFAAVAIASMVVGNLLALLQANVKRILAYSSIAHMGYLLVAFLAGGPLAASAVIFYLMTYFVTTLGAFGIVSLLSGPEHEADTMDDYRGLFWRRPWLAGVFAAMILSLAGLPLTAGFMGKFYLVVAGVAGAKWILVITLAATSTIGLYYYLRIVAAMFARHSETSEPLPRLPLVGSLTVAGLTIVLVWLGLLPGYVIEMIGGMM